MPTKPRAILLQFDYEHYCQGYEWVRGHQMLVYAVNFEQAVEMIQQHCKYSFPNACNFKNRTLG